MRFRDKVSTPVAVTALATVDVLVVEELSQIAVEVAVATAALTGFEIWGRVTQDGSDMQLYSTAGDFNTPEGMLIGASGDLTSQAVGSGWFVLDTRSFARITIKASSVGATVSLFMGASNG